MTQNLDPKKLEIINHVDGPLLVIAGPGAGKTMAIVERVVHLIGKCGVAPESIFISTFTEKAAAELLTRISRRLMEEGLKVSPNEMYIGTMHSLFLRILKDYSEFTRLKKNYKTFDDFDQNYTVYRKMYDFRKIENFDLVTDAQSNWTNAECLCGYLNKVREEALDPDALLSAPELEVKALGEAYKFYCEVLEGENAVDHDGSPKTSRDAFNLALFSQLLSKFEFIYSINVLNPKWLENDLRHLFCQFLHFIYKGGLEEFEDYEEPLPSGCVSVMTIHQSKGLEFPVTVVGSLSKTPRKSWTDLDATLEAKYFHRQPFEPLERTKFFDFWREYYVAFSRAQNLLVLQGVIDLLRGEGETVEIVDFKTDRKPDVNNADDMARVANCRRQLEVYSHIVEEKFGKCARLCDGCDMRFYCNYK